MIISTSIGRLLIGSCFTLGIMTLCIQHLLPHAALTGMCLVPRNPPAERVWALGFEHGPEPGFGACCIFQQSLPCAQPWQPAWSAVLEQTCSSS